MLSSNGNATSVHSGLCWRSTPQLPNPAGMMCCAMLAGALLGRVDQNLDASLQAPGGLVLEMQARRSPNKLFAEMTDRVKNRRKQKARAGAPMLARGARVTQEQQRTLKELTDHLDEFKAIMQKREQRHLFAPPSWRADFEMWATTYMGGPGRKFAVGWAFSEEARYTKLAWQKCVSRAQARARESGLAEEKVPPLPVDDASIATWKAVREAAAEGRPPPIVFIGAVDLHTCTIHLAPAEKNPQLPPTANWGPVLGPRDAIKALQQEDASPPPPFKIDQSFENQYDFVAGIVRKYHALLLKLLEKQGRLPVSRVQPALKKFISAVMTEGDHRYIRSLTLAPKGTEHVLGGGKTPELPGDAKLSAMSAENGLQFRLKACARATRSVVDYLGLFKPTKDIVKEYFSAAELARPLVGGFDLQAQWRDTSPHFVEVAKMMLVDAPPQLPFDQVRQKLEAIAAGDGTEAAPGARAALKAAAAALQLSATNADRLRILCGEFYKAFLPMWKRPGGGAGIDRGLDELVIDAVLVPRVMGLLKAKNSCARNQYEGLSSDMLAGMDQLRRTFTVTSASKGRRVALYDESLGLYGVIPHDLKADYSQAITPADDVCYHDTRDVGEYISGQGMRLNGVLARHHHCRGLSSHDCLFGLVGTEGKGGALGLGFSVVQPSIPLFDPRTAISHLDVGILDSPFFGLSITSRTLNNAGKFQGDGRGLGGRSDGQMSFEVAQSIFKSVWLSLEDSYGVVKKRFVYEPRQPTREELAELQAQQLRDFETDLATEGASSAVQMKPLLPPRLSRSRWWVRRKVVLLRERPFPETSDARDRERLLKELTTPKMAAKGNIFAGIRTSNPLAALRMRKRNRKKRAVPDEVFERETPADCFSCGLRPDLQQLLDSLDESERSDVYALVESKLSPDAPSTETMGPFDVSLFEELADALAQLEAPELLVFDA